MLGGGRGWQGKNYAPHNNQLEGRECKSHSEERPAQRKRGRRAGLKRVMARGKTEATHCFVTLTEVTLAKCSRAMVRHTITCSHPTDRNNRDIVGGVCKRVSSGRREGEGSGGRRGHTPCVFVRASHAGVPSHTPPHLTYS